MKPITGIKKPELEDYQNERKGVRYEPRIVFIKSLILSVVDPDMRVHY